MRSAYNLEQWESVSSLILRLIAVTNLVFLCCIISHLKFLTKTLSCLKLEQQIQTTFLPVSSLTGNREHNIDSNFCRRCGFRLSRRIVLHVQLWLDNRMLPIKKIEQ